MEKKMEATCSSLGLRNIIPVNEETDGKGNGH